MTLLLSIVIPTKNRPTTLSHAVRGALALPSLDLEVVVQDCSDDNATQDALASFAGDARLRYARSPLTPSMTENWNLALERVRGEYAIVIGDDDAVAGDIVNAALWARHNDVDAIADERLTYFWPNYQLREVAGSVRVPRHTGQVTFADAREALERALPRYPVNPQLLPHIYQGLTRMRVMNELKGRTGAFFGSMAPDYYSTIAISCIAGRFARATYPLCAAGASAAANAGRVHDRQDHLHALEYGQSRWSPYVPPFYLMTTAIVDATIKALRDMGRQDLIPMLDYSSFYADCLAQRPRSFRATAKEVGHLLHDHPSLRPVVVPRLLPRTVQMTWRRLRQLAGRPTAATPLKKLKSQLVHRDFDVLTASNIVEAIERSQRLLQSRGVESPFASARPSVVPAGARVEDMRSKA